MSKCFTCNGEMLNVAGCCWTHIRGNKSDNNKPMERIKYGSAEEQWLKFGIELDTNSRCGDCGCKVGKIHHHGCDIERCPKCEGQLISCDCELYILSNIK